MTVVLAGLLFCLHASAQDSCSNPITVGPYCVSVPIDVTGKEYNKVIPKFDTSLGDLISVKLTGKACGTTRLKLDSEDPNPQTWYITTRGGIILILPNGNELLTTFGTEQGDEDSLDTAEDSDEDPDFAGNDSGIIEYPNVCDEREFVLTGDDMNIFKGAAGETLPVVVKTNSSSTVRNPLSTNYASSSFARAGGDVCVEYTYCPRLCLNGTKFNADTGAGIEGWGICLTKPDGEPFCILTDVNGDYSFCDLLPGDYQVCEENRPGWKHLDPPCRAVTLEDENEDGVDFNNVPVFCINGSKINDCTDAGIEGWQITLKDSTGAIVAQKLTDANGDYSFCGLEPGDYTVCEEDRDGWVHLDDPCREVTLDDGNVEEVDFHNVPLFCISGHKYNSKTGEGIEGWKITLKYPDGREVSKLTETGGYYEFCGLAPGEYVVSEETRSGWTPTTPTSIPVTLDCANSENNDFKNQPSANLVCVCPFFIKNELYGASCKEVKVVDASKGILANDPAGSVVLNPESITIDPKYGTIKVHEDGSFVYDPTVATGKLYSGLYVMFKYTANNGFCDSKYPGIAKIQIRC